MKLLFRKIFNLSLLVYVFFFAYYFWQPPPDAIEQKSLTYNVPDSSVKFYADLTYTNKNGERVVEQQIWKNILQHIAEAKHFIILDLFLFNEFQGKIPESTAPLTKLLTEALVKKAENTNNHIAIALITDPINTVYGGVNASHLSTLQSKGIFVIMSNLNELPDSNRLWSSFWRPFISWWGNTTENGWLPHPFAFEGQKVSLRSWFSLFNFKANHRKLLVVDKEIQSGEHKGKQKNIAIVTSANPHDGSSAHGNIALEVHDHIWRDVIQNENQIAISAGAGIPRITGENVIDETGPIRVTFLHEKGIKHKVREILANAKNGDSIDISMFYLSDRDIINDLLSADTRNVQIRLILDTNHDAFGHNKHGIPNTPVAKELVKRSAGGIQIRWCKTNGEQCHAKLFMGKNATSSFLMVGSANFTRRNIDGFNLEANIYTEGDKDFSAWSDAHAYFEKLWTNNGGIFTTEYEAHKDTTFWKSSVARMMERTGLSSF